MKLTSCNDCGLSLNECSCSIVDEFEVVGEDNFLDDITELEASRKLGSSRCLCCFFYLCRCSQGLKAQRGAK